MDKATGKFFVEDDFFDNYASLCGRKATQVYCVLCRYANEDRQCSPSIKLLATKLGISRDLVIAGIKTLEAWKIIEVQKTRRNNGTWVNHSYKILDKNQWRKPECQNNIVQVKKAESENLIEKIDD